MEINEIQRSDAAKPETKRPVGRHSSSFSELKGTLTQITKEQEVSSEEVLVVNEQTMINSRHESEFVNSNGKSIEKLVEATHRIETPSEGSENVPSRDRDPGGLYPG